MLQDAGFRRCQYIHDRETFDKVVHAMAQSILDALIKTQDVRLW